MCAGCEDGDGCERRWEEIGRERELVSSRSKQAKVEARVEGYLDVYDVLVGE